MHGKGKDRCWYHGRVNGRRIFLQARLRRFWCPSCQRTFTETYPGIRLRARRTEQAEHEVLEELRTGTLGALRKRFGVAYCTAVEALQRRVPRQLNLGKLLKDVPEAALGIDEHSFRGRDLVITVTLLQPRRQLVAILAKVVVDHFHVIQDANRRLDQARVLEQQYWRRSIPHWPLLKNFERLTAKQEVQLHAILHTYPVLAAFYRL